MKSVFYCSCALTLLFTSASFASPCGNLDIDIKPDGNIDVRNNYEFTQKQFGRTRDFSFAPDGNVSMTVQVGDSYLGPNGEQPYGYSKTVGMRELRLLPLRDLKKAAIESCNLQTRRVQLQLASGYKATLNIDTGQLIQIGHTEFASKITQPYKGPLSGDPDLHAKGGGLEIVKSQELILDSGFITPAYSSPTAYPTFYSTLKDTGGRTCKLQNSKWYTPENWKPGTPHPEYNNPIFNFKTNAEIQTMIKNNCPQIAWSDPYSSSGTQHGTISPVQKTAPAPAVGNVN